MWAWWMGVALAGAPEGIPVDGGEVLVYGDRFARWDHTRWYAETQIGFYKPFTLYAREDFEVRYSALQLRTTLACEKTWRRGPSGFQVECTIEAISARGLTCFDHEPRADLVLTELDDLLTGARLRFEVRDDGRLSEVGILGLSRRDPRDGAIHENARQLLKLTLSDFYMRLPRDAARAGDTWVEYDSPVFMLPSHAKIDVGPLDPRASLGSSQIVHQVNPYRGHLVVQSVGKALVADGSPEPATDNLFTAAYDGVAIYDPATGVMTERVFAVRGEITAGSPAAAVTSDIRYYHSGRIRMLQPAEQVDVGFSGRVVTASDAADHPGVRLWEMMQ
jgi:hypothetical protein